MQGTVMIKCLFVSTSSRNQARFTDSPGLSVLWVVGKSWFCSNWKIQKRQLWPWAGFSSARFEYRCCRAAETLPCPSYDFIHGLWSANKESLSSKQTSHCPWDALLRAPCLWWLLPLHVQPSSAGLPSLGRAISVFFQESLRRRVTSQSSSASLWASRLERVKPFIPLCSNGSSQHPTRAKYSCCRKSMLVGASVRHAWEHRFPSAPWRHLSGRKKAWLARVSCGVSPLCLRHWSPGPSPRSSCRRIISKELLWDFVLLLSYWDRLNCIWPYFCSGHFDLAKSRVASET